MSGTTTAARRRSRSSGSVWRQEVVTRADELDGILDWLAPPEAERKPEQRALIAAIRRDLDVARSTAETARGLNPGIINGAQIQGATYVLDAAEVNLYRLAHLPFLTDNLPEIIAEAAEVLPATDRRLVLLTELSDKVKHSALGEQDRGAIVAAVRGAKRATLQAEAKVRAFRNVLLYGTMLAALVTFAFAVVGILRPSTIPLCQTNPTAESLQIICPASGPQPQSADILIVLFAGLLGATISVVFSLRKVRGTADPYSVPLAAALLKLPTGALTAALGLLLIRGGFVPGFTGLDSSAQIIAWAVIFGYSQELFTSFVDRQAQAVLAAAPTPTTAAPAPDPKQPAPPSLAAAVAPVS
jgi:hypothetical protein